MLLLNARSFCPPTDTTWKLEVVRDMVDGDATPVAFLGITETWWRCYMTEAQVQIPGYNLARCDRPGRTGGGCALYVHNSMAITDQVEFSDRCNNMTAVYIGSRQTIAAVVQFSSIDS